MADKNHVQTKEVLADIRAGMTDGDLRDKYRLTAKGLAGLLHRLMDSGAITIGELVCRSGSNEEEEFSGCTTAEFRMLGRDEIDFPLVICDAENSDFTGLVKDISDDGIRIGGLETEVDEIRTFSLRADELFQVEPILFEAKCRWVFKEGLLQVPVAGFVVTKMMEGSLKDLRDIMARLSLEERKAFKKRF